MGIELNGLPVVTATIHEPLFGVWFADVEVDSDDDIIGPVVLDVEGIEFAATPQPSRAGIESGRWIARIIGGAAGMQTVVAAKNYVGVNVRAIVNELLLETGESLDVDGSDAALLARVMPRWHRIRATAGTVLRLLLESLGASFRMQRSGTLFVGEQGFSEIDEREIVIESHEPALNMAIAAPERPLVEPGTTFDSKAVSHVVTRVSPGGMRQEVWFRDE